MRTLWRTTTHLFWQYPILWLPVLLADLIAFCLRLLQGWASQAVIQSLVVFAVSKLLVEFLNLCLYVTAMIVISILVPALIAQTKTQWQQILFAVKQLRVQILLFSMKIFGMLLVATFLNIELMAYLPRLHLLPTFSTFSASRDQSLALIALLFAALAWLATPTAVTLLRPPESPPNGTKTLRHARIFAAVSVLTTVALYYLAIVAKPSFAPLLTTAFGVQLFWGIASAVSATPYIPLFIALHLIANPDGPLTTQPTPEIEADLPPGPTA